MQLHFEASSVRYNLVPPLCLLVPITIDCATVVEISDIKALQLFTMLISSHWGEIKAVWGSYRRFTL